jgi:hypothetical protein
MESFPSVWQAGIARLPVDIALVQTGSGQAPGAFKAGVTQQAGHQGKRLGIKPAAQQISDFMNNRETVIPSVQ